MAATTDARFAMSPLVAMECLVAPLRRGDTALEAHFQNTFQRFTPLDINESVFLAAAGLRARFRLKTPDALHLACAAHHKCAALWTADQRFGAAGGSLVRVLTP